MYILNPDIEPNNPELFTVAGDLSTAGKNEFWREINRQMRLFDRHEIDFTAVTNADKQEKLLKQARDKPTGSYYHNGNTASNRIIPQDRNYHRSYEYFY